MQPADEFDDFYKSTRTSLLQQTFALTGDLPASRSAVRDAFVAAWHHWRKVSRLEDPEAWVRPLAWRHAQRRHSARIFHRDRKLDPDIRATLDALAKLPITQRKVLLLTQLADVSMADMAREVGLTQHDAETRLQLATAEFAMQREVPTTAIRPLFEPLRDHVADVRWPRVTIIRRAGTTRRRTHTAVGAVAVVGALVLGGAAVTDAQGVRPSLENARSTGVAALRLGTGPAGSEAPEPDAEAAAAHTLVAISPDDLVTVDQLTTRLPGRWRQAGTGGAQTGILMPCQSTRFADPEGNSSAVQQFKAPARKKQSRRSMVQTVEMSTTNSDAKAAYDVMRGWFGGCTDARVQLISTYDVDRVGDDATLLVLRSWKKPETTMVAGVARTGRATTITFTAGPGHRPARPRRRGRPAGRRRQRPVRPAGDRAVRREARARRHRARPGRRRPRDAQRGGPAARRGRRTPLDRDRGPRRPHQPGRQPVRRHPLRRQGHATQHDPLVRHPRGEALGPLRADRDRRSAAVEAGPRLRRRRPHPARLVRRP